MLTGTLVGEEDLWLYAHGEGDALSRGALEEWLGGHCVMVMGVSEGGRRPSWPELARKFRKCRDTFPRAGRHNSVFSSVQPLPVPLPAPRPVPAHLYPVSTWAGILHWQEGMLIKPRFDCCGSSRDRISCTASQHHQPIHVRIPSSDPRSSFLERLWPIMNIRQATVRMHSLSSGHWIHRAHLSCPLTASDLNKRSTTCSGCRTATCTTSQRTTP